MKKLRLLFLMSLFQLISCSDKKASNYHVTREYKRNSTQVETYKNVRLKELLSSPKKYHGEKIEVEGYYMTAFEVSCLYVSKEAMDGQNNKKAIWVTFSNYDSLININTGKGFLSSYEERNSNNKKRVIIQGIFSTDNTGHLNDYIGGLQNIRLLRIIE